MKMNSGVYVAASQPVRGFVVGSHLVSSLYLTSVFFHDMSSGNPDVIDRRSRGLQRPWDSAGRHVYILNKPEQLRGPLSPHRKDGTQNWEAGISGPSVVACVPLSTQGRLCVLDSQDSCCPRILSPWHRYSPQLDPYMPKKGISRQNTRI
jgi:hypothetical protein